MKIRNGIFGLMIMFSIILAGCGAKKAQTATLELPSNPTTGYEWQAVQDKELFDISSEYVEDEKDQEMVGVGGRQIFTLTPKEAGKTTVTFSYIRPWEEGVEPESKVSYQMEVSKDLQIKVLSSTGALPGNMNTVPDMPDMEIK